MSSIDKKRIIIIDTSAILSGKQLIFNDSKIITSPGVLSEIKPGGRDYKKLENLIDLGLSIHEPSKDSINQVMEISKKTGDLPRLSKTDIEILALALEKEKTNDTNTLLLTDDYSIQNVANELEIKYEPISQSKIIKKFIWISRCQGCGKKYKEHIKTCPFCGSETKSKLADKHDL
jgi:UPF0271 protein